MNLSLKFKELKWRRKSWSLKRGNFRVLRRKILLLIGLGSLPSILCYSLSWPIISQPPNILYNSITTQLLSSSSCLNSPFCAVFRFSVIPMVFPFIHLPWSPQPTVAPPCCSQNSERHIHCESWITSQKHPLDILESTQKLLECSEHVIHDSAFLMLKAEYDSKKMHWFINYIQNKSVYTQTASFLIETAFFPQGSLLSQTDKTTHHVALLKINLQILGTTYGMHPS